MVIMYRPTSNYSKRLQLLVPTYEKVEGKIFKDYKEDMMFWATFKSYGGTDLKGSQDKGNLLTIIDTVNITTPYNPNFKSGCRIKDLDNNAIYDIINEPEDVECRHMITQFKMQRIKGGV